MDNQRFHKSFYLETIFTTRHWGRTEEISDMILTRYYAKRDKHQHSAARVVSILKNDPSIQLLIDSMNELQVPELYVSYIHGQRHIERVSVLSFFLGRKYLSQPQLKILLECAKYHDIGRIDDSNDPVHGARGAAKIDKICTSYSDDDKLKISAVIEAHSVSDAKTDEIFHHYGITDEKDRKECLLLLYILKDADALDRFRLNNHSLDPQYLRLKESQYLIQAACEFVNL